MSEVMRELIEKLKESAAEESIPDSLDAGDFLDIDDHAGGNIDDAYYMGQSDGRIEFARDLLTLLGIDYK